MKDLSGWGRYPRLFGPLTTARTAASAARLTAAAPGVVARGLGRAYGDAAIGREHTLAPAGLDRLQGFNPDTGLLQAEAGVSLNDILTNLVPRGFFPPVVPGTRFVTVGGMIASDVHGKNQHNDGTFGEHVEALSLALPDGRTIRCARDENPELFHATIGGMGLTGTILDASFRLRRVETGWIRQTTSVAENLSEAIALLGRTSGATYTVAWIDVLARGAALGRSLILEGEHAARDELGPRQAQFPPARTGRVGVPFDMPGGLLNARTVSAFNALYYRKGARRAGRTTLVPWDSYFFPLDGIARWNRIYGPRGFVQHQCVIPEARAEAVLSAILDRLSQTGTGSFLAVLKRLRAGTGLMSFPMDGLTLALDIPVSERGLALLAEIDGLVSAAGGRLYLAKDACQSRDTFEAGYPNIAAFREVRRDAGALGHMSSKQSERLGL
ncbi:putative decaprenylphosphoryl-beta-D-ribose oxidase [Roseivivax jejudonensis]|uniref:Putative decaprenylphosphoryl-beta-D-ribose oxidase n=1 Tax=Roseivivax jejudonensis TaxID=1529041 RepID=A0A1X6ZYD6_9RHOB|nr:FAD-binding oxidoreductase [Roseivivax jejudonensis]SLN65171.1 putative decaprenylphosphoryl-beta-D-ribose oxidase [Roseivivax jejudonensis]